MKQLPEAEWHQVEDEGPSGACLWAVASILAWVFIISIAAGAWFVLGGK